MGYALPANYSENQVRYFVDDVTQVLGVVFQPDVYSLALLLADLTGAHGIVDVGCGYADKLAAIHAQRPDLNLTGVDFGVNIDHCRQQYDWGTWVDLDLERSQPIPALRQIVVCSDVIEHLADPAALLETLRDCGALAILISTPARDLLYGRVHAGPPQNPCHVREWNPDELREYLKSCGLNVEWLGLSRASSQGEYYTCTLAICR